MDWAIWRKAIDDGVVKSEELTGKDKKKSEELTLVYRRHFL